MDKKTITLPFDGSDLKLHLPETWMVESIITPKTYPALKDVKKGLLKELDSPIGTVALKNRKLQGKKIVIVTDDITRPTPLNRYFGSIIDYCISHGAKKKDILILMALGVHRPMTKEEVEMKLGKKAITGINWVNHDCHDVMQNVTLGTTKRGTPVALNRHLTEADLILCVGAIEPHLLLGFGGGLKMLLPGTASAETIARNHMQGVSPEMFNYIGAIESPMRLDLEEAAMMLRKDIFIINAVLNEKHEICRFVCGDPVKAHRDGVQTVIEINSRGLDRQADVAIVVSNPMNADLRQGMKCVGNIEKSVKENGLILAFLGCEHGLGDISLPPKPMSNKKLRFILRLLGKKRILWFLDKVKKGSGIEERFMAHFSMQVVRKNQLFMFSHNLPHDTGEKLGIFRQFRDIDEMMAAAREFAPKNSTVYVYPYGGVTYPVMNN